MAEPDDDLVDYDEEEVREKTQPFACKRAVTRGS